MPRRLDTREASFETAFSALIEIRRETQAEVMSMSASNPSWILAVSASTVSLAMPSRRGTPP